MSGDAYPYFDAWEESLEFEVDGVTVRAVARHSYREETIRIVSPFIVEGHVHNVGFRPVLVVLGPAMAARSRALQSEGLTVRDDCIRMAKNLFLMHATKLMFQTEINKVRADLVCVYQPELDDLKARFHRKREEMRSVENLIKNEMYNEKGAFSLKNEMNSLKKKTRIYKELYEALIDQVEREIDLIERRLIQAVMHRPMTTLAPLLIEKRCL